MRTNVKVENMVNHNGNDIPNQFIIKTDEGTYFQSYKSIVVFESKDGTIHLDADKWDYSVTTGRYRNFFLGESKKETEAKIKSGAYKLVDLNQK